MIDIDAYHSDDTKGSRPNEGVVKALTAIANELAEINTRLWELVEKSRKR